MLNEMNYLMFMGLMDEWKVSILVTLAHENTYTGGYSRSTSLRNALKYFISLMWSYVGLPVLPTASNISCRRRRSTSGYSDSMYSEYVRRQAVCLGLGARSSMIARTYGVTTGDKKVNKLQ